MTNKVILQLLVNVVSISFVSKINSLNVNRINPDYNYTLF